VRRRLWLALLLVYAAAGIADGAMRMTELRRAPGHPGIVAALPVAFCAGLFWPIDLVARRTLG
jgi:hypothetical protein